MVESFQLLFRKGFPERDKEQKNIRKNHENDSSKILEYFQSQNFSLVVSTKFQHLDLSQVKNISIISFRFTDNSFMFQFLYQIDTFLLNHGNMGFKTEFC